MSGVRSVLMLSNGHGEDIIGSAILEDLLAKQSNLWITVLPIVGEGRAYDRLAVKIVGPRKKLPTGGFMRQNIKNFFKDVKGGLFGLTFNQINVLRQLRNEVDLVVCVGDVLLVILAGLFLRKPMVFVPTAKSEYISGHYGVEKVLMRKYADLVLPRDEKTAQVLRESGVNAVWVGNAMMDSFEITGTDFGISKNARVVGILPGSREEAYSNIKTVLQVIEELERLKCEEMEYLLALANQLSLEILERNINTCGWFFEKIPDLVSQGVCARITNPKGFSIKITKSQFGDVLEQSDIFIGLAGTANEQAVGMGKPVVAFPTTGPQFNKKFVQAQKKLLGDSISVVEPKPEKIAEEILIILHDQQVYEKMAAVGRERMGPRGGVDRMTKTILHELNGKKSPI